MGIPELLQKAISRQATAERERRAIVVQAEGEKEAARKLAEAAQILSSQEGGLYVRLLRAIPEVVSQPGTTVAFPLPVELRQLLPELKEKPKE